MPRADEHLTCGKERLRLARSAGFAGVGQGANGEALIRTRGWLERARNEFRLRSWEHGAEFAGGKRVQGAEAVGKFGGGYAALAAEGAEKIVGGGFAFLGVAPRAFLCIL